MGTVSNLPEVPPFVEQASEASHPSLHSDSQEPALCWATVPVCASGRSLSRHTLKGTQLSGSFGEDVPGP